MNICQKCGERSVSPNGILPTENRPQHFLSRCKSCGYSFVTWKDHYRGKDGDDKFIRVEE